MRGKLDLLDPPEGEAGDEKEPMLPRYIRRLFLVLPERQGSFSHFLLPRSRMRGLSLDLLELLQRYSYSCPLLGACDFGRSPLRRSVRHGYRWTTWCQPSLYLLVSVRLSITELQAPHLATWSSDLWACCVLVLGPVASQRVTTML